MRLKDDAPELDALRQRWLDAQTRRLEAQKAAHPGPLGTTREAQEEERLRYAEYAAARDQEELRLRRDK